MMGYGEPMNFDKKKPISGLVWNILTVLTLLACVVMVSVFMLIFSNPKAGINPFPPKDPPQMIIVPTFTPTIEIKTLPPTWTSTFTLVPSNTFTPLPPTATATIYILPRTPTEPPTQAVTTPAGSVTPVGSPTATVAGNMPFNILGVPTPIASTIVHPETACNWLGVGGQVLDLKGAPVVGITIQLGGYLGEKTLNLLSLSGTASEYDRGGYEFTLGAKPVASTKTLWLQMLDQAGLPLSNKIRFDTFDDCAKNLILINFKQVR